MSFAKFRTNNSIDNLKNKFDKLNNKRSFGNESDETYWTPKHVAGPEGVGEAVFRFLPAPPDGRGGQEPDDVVKYYQFAIRKNGKFYLNRGRNSLGVDEPDPANDYNKSIWARQDIGKEEKKKLLVDRSEYYIANIYIVKDPNKPENEGKVFRYQFGRQIYNKINLQLFPEFETDPSVNVFDPIDGADFIFRVTHKTIPDSFSGEMRKVPTYENSKFLAPSQRWSLDEFDEIWKQCHSLQSEIAEDKFRSYDDLKRQFDRVMGPTNIMDADNLEEFRDNQKSAQAPKNTTAPKQEKTLAEELDDEVPWITGEEEQKEEKVKSSSDDDEIDDWFSNLGK